MRATILILSCLVLGCIAATSATAAAAESVRLPAAGKTSSVKTLPLKGTTGAVQAGSCASYGPRFVMVEGTGTCVKVGGSISIDATVRR